MANNALYLVLDMINDLVDENGPGAGGPLIEQLRTRHVIENTRTALARAREAGARVGYVRVGFSADYQEVCAVSPMFSKIRDSGVLRLGTRGTMVHRDLTPDPNDFDIIKHRVSPFYGTNLELLIRTYSIRRLYISGVSTTAAVQACVRDGHDRDLECHVLEDCCACASEQTHEQSVAMMARFAKITTASTAAFQ